MKKNNVQSLLCKCTRNSKLFSIRIENKEGSWEMTWAFKIEEKSAKSDKYNKITIRGSIGAGSSYPGCPYCGTKDLFKCGKCGKLTCWNGQDAQVTCQHCNVVGKLEGTIQELFVNEDYSSDRDNNKISSGSALSVKLD